MSTYDPSLFFAIKLNTDLQQALAELIDKLKQKSWGNHISWVHPENLHVALRSLGASPHKISELEALEVSASKEIKGINPFPLQLSNTHLSPSPTAPRTIVVSIAPIPELFELAHALERAVTKVGFTPEAKPYLPHLTLGHIKNHYTVNLTEKHCLNIAPMKVDSITLLSSERIKDIQPFTPLRHIFLEKTEETDRVVT